MIAERIQSIRKKRGMSLAELADKTGLSKSFLWEVEVSRRPNLSINSLTALASGLGVTPSFLLSGDPLGEDAEDDAFFHEYKSCDAATKRRMRRMLRVLRDD